MSNTKLEKTTAEIKALRETAAIEPDTYPDRTRAAAAAARNEARQLLGPVIKEYRDTVGKKTKAILLNGTDEQIQAFKTELESSLKDGDMVIQVHGAPVYAQIASRFFPSMGASKEFTSAHANLFMEELRAIVSISNFPGMVLAPELVQGNTLQTFEDAVTFAKDVLVKRNGEGLNTFAIMSNVLDEALNRDFAGENLFALVVRPFPVTWDAISFHVASVRAVDLSMGENIEEQVSKVAKPAGKKSARPNV